MSMKSSFVLMSLLVALAACSKMEPSAPAPTPATAKASKADAPFQAGPVSVSSWGPQSTTPGTVANPLPNGNTGMYFVMSRSMEGADVEVLFDGQPLKGVAVDGATVTAELPASQFATAGDHAITIKVGGAPALDVGHFTVGTTPANAGSPTAAATSAAGSTEPQKQ